MATKRKTVEEPLGVPLLQLVLQRAEAALVDLETARVQQEAAKRRLLIAELDVEHSRACIKLHELRDGDAVDGKVKREQVGGSASAAVGGGPAAEAKQRLLTAKLGLRALEMEHNRRLERQQDMAAQLAELRGLRSAIQQRQEAMTIVADDESEWFEKTLECDLRTLIHKPSRDQFLEELAAAPCLGTLSLKLVKRLEDSFEEEFAELPKAVVQALMKAPAKTRKLSLELELDSGDLLFALLERTKGHLQELECTAFPRLSDGDLRRFWSLLVGSSVEAVKLAPESLDVCFPFQTGAWPSLRRLDFFQRPRDLAVRPGMLALLIRANATANATDGLRAVGLPWQMAPPVRQAVYQALAACPALEELSSPCYRELTLVSACAGLSSLRLVGNLDDDDDDVSERREAVEAAGRLLRNPAVAARLTSLSLHNFQLDHQDGDYLDGRVDSDEKRMDVNEEGFLTEHILGLKRLESLTLERCQGVGGALGKILPQLPSLLELYLIKCRYLETALVKKYLTPENAQLLQTFEVNPDESDVADEWDRTMKCIRRRFRRVSPTFLGRDPSPSGLKEEDDEEEEDEDAEGEEEQEEEEEEVGSEEEEDDGEQGTTSASSDSDV